jgi:phosphatidylglycerophosphatase A
MSLRLNRLIASVGGIGYLPLAPGTWASAIAVIAWYFITTGSNENYFLQTAIIGLAIAAGIYSSNKIVHGDDKDPSHIVIDELAGMWTTLLMIPAGKLNFVAGFVLFRFFDIVKPFGIKRMENYRSGWGIMLDDLLAGVYSNILLRVILFSKIW